MRQARILYPPAFWTAQWLSTAKGPKLDARVGSERFGSTATEKATPGMRRGHGFTLVELLITIAIIAILLALLLPSARSAVAAARGFKCQTAQRSVAFDFGIYADESLHPWRGDDESLQGGFRLETFIESQYGVDEFWDSTYGSVATAKLPDANGRDPMRCPEVKGDLTLRRALPCTQGAINPPQAISFGFNMRLHLSDARWDAGNPGPATLTNAKLTSGTAAPSAIPLLWDIDGETAVQRQVVPLFSAPALDSASLYAGNRYWFPAMRHNGHMTVGFVDGHVASTRAPLAEPGWAWSFDPGR